MPGESPEKAKAVEMKYSMQDRLWKAAVKDSEGSGFDMTWSVEDISYIREGSTYSFSTEKAGKR